MRKVSIIAAAALFLASCDTQRDLYVEARPLIYVEGDWVPSLGQADMSMNATAVAYSAGGLYAKEYFYNDDNTTVPVDKGLFDVMIFNGLMYSEQDTHLSNVFFRGTETLDGFEAVASEGPPVRRLTRADGEYIASNEMEIVTSAVQQQEIESGRSYSLKYKDGKNGFPVQDDYIEAELYMTPAALSYQSKITVTIKNISSAYGANAALYGFVGSVFMASRMPSHFYVTHQFNLNNKTIISAADDTGTIESPAFITFGPPVDVPDNKYEVYLRIVLVDSSVFETTVDISGQVLPVIEMIRENLDPSGPLHLGITIPLAIGVIELPIVDPVEGGVGLDDWGDDEIIKFPIKQ